MRTKLLVMAAAITSMPISLAAQRIVGPAMTLAECTAALAALSTGDRDASKWVRVHECGAAGAAALASTLANVQAETDTLYLSGLLFAATHIQSRDVFAAAVQQFLDASGTAQARVSALSIVLGQREPGGGGWPLGRSWSDMVATPLEAPCLLGSGVHGFYSSIQSAPTPADLQQAAAAFDEVANRHGDPAVIRALARCARTVLLTEVPEAINPALVTLTYECGTRFKVQNLDSKWISVTYRVVGTTEQGRLSVPGMGQRVWETDATGTVEILSGGEVIKTAPNAGTICPP